MKQKQLVSTTIIPPHLYVERGADRQIKDIVSQAGRPGYILVSRQMGKTNLLIHTKNSFQDEQNLFIYIDLSITLSSATECFQYIIDTAISSHEKQLGHLKKVFADRRKESPAPPYKEHEQELLDLLKCVSGKIVIILDEIDSLKRTTFSDQIFAQIRTMYFARVNYADLSRLTYLLSGVAEPKDLIKNKEMSPFNIGEKIYLDDFSRDEFESFITKTKLEIDSASKERIFYWTNGNPRMAWDICSKIEDRILQNEPVNEKTIDTVVSSLYLDRFDIAPVDHIRTLVEEDEDLQNALVEIQYLKHDNLSDDTKSKLYLAGIIKAAKNQNDAKIKNPIIEATLSDSWLKKISRKKKTLAQLAKEKFENEEYPSAIGFFEQVLTDKSLSKPDYRTNQLMLAHCYFFTGENKKALNSFKEAINDKEGFAEAYYENIFYQGHCHFRMNDFDKAVKCFTEVTESDFKNRNYYRSKINIGSSYTQIDANLYKQTIIDIYNNVIESLSTETLSGIDDSEKNALIVSASFNLAHAFLRDGQKTLAHDKFRQAEKNAQKEQKPAILVELIKFVPQKEAILILKEIESIIQEDNLLPVSNPLSPVSYSGEVFSKVLIEAHRLKQIDVFSNLTDLFLKHIRRMNQPDYTLLTSYADDYFQRGHNAVAFDFIKNIIDRHEAFIDDDEAVLSLYRLFGMSTAKDSKPYFDRFISKIKPEDFGEFDIAIAYNRISTFISSGEIQYPLNLIKFFQKLDRAKSKTSFFMFVFDYLEMQILIKQGQILDAREKAASLVDELHQKLPHFKEGLHFKTAFLHSVLNQAQSYVGQNINPAKKQVEFERNQWVKVQYADGRTMEIKYKKVAEDIRNGICKIIL